jgi:hypothetical protein
VRPTYDENEATSGAAVEVEGGVWDAVPAGSMVMVARVMDSRPRLSASERSCTASPPRNSGSSSDILGMRMSEVSVSSWRLSMSQMYAQKLISSAPAVASAAPARRVSVVTRRGGAAQGECGAGVWREQDTVSPS